MFFTGEVRVFTESFALRAFSIPACHSHSQSTSVLLRAHVRGDPEKFLMFFVSKLTEHRKLFRLGKQDVSGFALATCYEYKKSPAKRVSLPRTNKQIIYPRCHLDSQLTLRRLAGYQHIPGNSRIPTRCRILRKNPFPCTLSGPFDNLFLTRFSASRVLCKGIVAVISTSTVYNIQLLRTDFTRKNKSCQAKKSYGIIIICIFLSDRLVLPPFQTVRTTVQMEYSPF